MNRQGGIISRLLLVFVIGIIYCNEASSFSGEFSRKCSLSFDAVSIFIFNEAKNEEIVFLSNIVRDWTISINQSGIPADWILSRPSSSKNDTASFWVFSFIRPFHWQDSFNALRQERDRGSRIFSNYALYFGNGGLSVADVRYIELADWNRSPFIYNKVSNAQSWPVSGNKLFSGEIYGFSQQMGLNGTDYSKCYGCKYKPFCEQGKLSCVFNQFSVGLQLFIAVGILLFGCFLYGISYSLFERGSIKIGLVVGLFGLLISLCDGFMVTGFI